MSNQADGREIIDLSPEEWALIGQLRSRSHQAPAPSLPITPDQIAFVERCYTKDRQRKSPAGVLLSTLNSLAWLMMVALIAFAVYSFGPALLPPSQAAASPLPTTALSTPTALTSPPVGSQGYSGGPEQNQPVPAAVVAPTAPPEPPGATPQPTADLANVSDVDTLANAIDLASGGNPGAMTPIPTGAELPTVVARPVDPSGGDAATLARACANSGAGASCAAPAAVVNEAEIACATDLAYGGVGCVTPVVGREP